MRHLVTYLCVVGATACGCVRAAEEGPLEEARFARLRESMVKHQIEAEGVRDKRVLAAMRKVRRHEFCPHNVRRYAYQDSPLPIGKGQTISQPYIVAAMTELLALKGGEKVLEIGTGSGYQAAVLAELVKDVYTIEIVPFLAERAKRDLARLGYKNVHVLCGDGFKGWPKHAPFDGVIVTGAPETVPAPLIEQLKVGGRLVIPVGPQWRGQWLKVLTKTEQGVETKEVLPVRFVPMTGEAEKRK